MANSLSFTQCSTLLNAITSQVTGKSSLAAVDESSFVAQAQTTLKAGYDPVLNAVSQVLSKTIFSNRPYARKFAKLYADEVRFGNHVRKLQVIDKEFEDDNRVSLTDGSSIDQQTVKKPEVIQTNFYGQNVVGDHITIFKDQLDVAFSSSSEFGQFISMVMQNMSDRIEQKHETIARATIANMIAAKVNGDSGNVIHLLDAYQAETGVSLTTATVKDPANYPEFARWLFGYLRTLSEKMTERSCKYHMNLTIDGNAKKIMRHTPMAKQKVYLYAPELNAMDARVLSTTFHTNYLDLVDHEFVNFWQSIETPDSINVKPAYIGTTGAVVENPAAVSQANIFGVIFDEEACGYTTINTSVDPAPYNAAGRYSNLWYHFTDRPWNDMTENCVVLLLDKAAG